MTDPQAQKSTEVSQAIYILFASGFAEGDVIACLDPLEAAGVAPLLVGPSTRRVRGRHGLTAQPTLTLEQVQALPPPRAIVIPGGDESLRALWADPRAHGLLSASLRAGALVGAFGAGQTQLSHLAWTLEASGLLIQGDRTPADFVAEMIARLGAGPEAVTAPGRAPNR